MSQARRIPAELHGPLLVWLQGAHPDGRSRSQADATAWLRDVHGIRVGRMAVTRLVAAHSKRGEALLVEALKGALLDAVAPALDRLRRASRQLDRAIVGEEDVKSLAVATRAQVAALDSLAKLAGVAAPLAVDVTIAQPEADPASLAARLQAVAARAAAAVPADDVGVLDPGAAGGAPPG